MSGYPMLERLRQKRVLALVKWESGTEWAPEGGYTLESLGNGALLTPAEVLALADELRKMVGELPKETP